MNDLDFTERYDPIHATKELRRKAASFFNTYAEQRYSLKINSQKNDKTIKRVSKTAEKILIHEPD